MNTRIQELREKAIVEVQGHGAFGEPEWYNELDEDKFAELIVKECASIYEKIDNGNQHMGTSNYLKALQKHFGIK